MEKAYRGRGVNASDGGVANSGLREVMK